MKNKKSLFWQLTWKIAVFCLLTFIIGCFFTEALPWGAGVLLGGGFTILRLKWMDYTIEKAVMGDPEKASGIMTRGYFARYVLSAGVLVLAALIPQISVYSTMIAMVSLKAATFLQGLLEKETPKDGSVQFEEWVDEEEDEENGPEEQWDRWETYNLKARRRLIRNTGSIKKVQKPAEPEPPSEGEQLSLFEENEES